MRYEITVMMVSLLVLISGCSMLGPETPVEPTATSNQTPTETQTETRTAVDTDTDTEPNPTHSPSPTKSRAERYGYFKSTFHETLTKNGINMIEITTSPENRSMVLTYEMANPENSTKTLVEEETILFTFAGNVEAFLKDRNDYSFDWVPKHFEIRAIDPDDNGLYFSSHTNSTMAKYYVSGNGTWGDYYTNYQNSTKFGESHER